MKVKFFAGSKSHADQGEMTMPLYQYNPEKTEPGKLAPLLNLAFDSKTLPYAHFFRGKEPVGYLVRPGVIDLLDEIQIPANMLLKRV